MFVEFRCGDKLDQHIVLVVIPERLEKLALKIFQTYFNTAYFCQHIKKWNMHLFGMII